MPEKDSIETTFMLGSAYGNIGLYYANTDKWLRAFWYGRKGIKNVKDSPSRVKDAIKSAESMGAKVTGVYSVMGEYDLVTVGEFPSDEAAMTFALATGALGNVRSKTLKAFTQDEFAAIVKKLP